MCPAMGKHREESNYRFCGVSKWFDRLRVLSGVGFVCGFVDSMSRVALRESPQTYTTLACTCKS